LAIVLGLGIVDWGVGSGIAIGVFREAWRERGGNVESTGMAETR